MKIIAINGSAHADGNTHRALEIMEDVLEKSNIEVEIYDLVDYKLYPFTFTSNPPENDIPFFVKKIKGADGLILASPTYYSNVTSRMQMFIEQIGTLSKKAELKGKVGAAVAVARRQGANFVYAALNYFFGIHEMPIATSTNWNLVVAQKPGDIEKDKEGIKTLENLAENMANMIHNLRV